MRIILDECVSPGIVAKCWEIGLDTIHVRDRDLLGTPDHELWRYTLQEQRVLVTINGGDFRKLAAATAEHHGIVIFPSGGTRAEQMDYLRTAFTYPGLSNAYGNPFANRVVEVSSELEVQVDIVAFDPDA